MASPARVLHLFPRFRPSFAGDGLYFEKLWPHPSAGDGGHDVLVFTTLRPAEIPSVAPPRMNLIYLRRSEAESAPAVLLRYYLWLLRNIRRYDIIHARTHIDRFFVLNWIARFASVRSSIRRRSTIRHCTFSRLIARASCASPLG